MKHVLVLPDIHFPHHDQRTLNAVESYMADNEWDEVVWLGDLIDFDYISSHERGNLRGRVVAQNAISRDYNLVNSVLDRHAKIVGPHTKQTIIQGNHDFRVERFIDENPALEGLAEVENGLHLRDRGIQWVQGWSKGEIYRIGKAAFVHGLYITEHHAKKMVQAFGENVFYGHTHDIQTYSQTKRGDNNTIVGQSLGCLCRYDQKYMKGRPSAWQQAFGEFYIKPNGHFNYYVIRIVNHSFVAPDGEEYAG
jgi:predicted phosphodiesterase